MKRNRKIILLIILLFLLLLCITQCENIARSIVGIYIDYASVRREFPSSGEYGNSSGLQITISPRNSIFIHYPDGNTEPCRLRVGNGLIGEASDLFAEWRWNQKKDCIIIEIIDGNAYLVEGEKYFLYPISELE